MGSETREFKLDSNMTNVWVICFTGGITARMGEPWRFGGNSYLNFGDSKRHRGALIFFNRSTLTGAKLETATADLPVQKFVIQKLQSQDTYMRHIMMWIE